MCKGDARHYVCLFVCLVVVGGYEWDVMTMMLMMMMMIMTCMRRALACSGVLKMGRSRLRGKSFRIERHCGVSSQSRFIEYLFACQL